MQKIADSRWGGWCRVVFLIQLKEEGKKVVCFFFSQKEVILLQLLCCVPIYAEGFAAGTLVKTPHGFAPIENIQINDSVMCRDNSNVMTAKPVLCVCKKSFDSHVRIYFDDFCLMVSDDQLFYEKEQNKWVRADQLCINDYLCATDNKMCVVQHVEYNNEPIELYCLYIKDHHNFCVASSEVIVHNFIPFVVAATWAFGAGGIELVKLGFGFLGGTLIGYSLYKKQHKAQKSYNVSVVSFSGGMFPEDPDDDEQLTNEEKKNQRDQARVEHRSLTNQEA